MAEPAASDLIGALFCTVSVLSFGEFGQPVWGIPKERAMNAIEPPQVSWRLFGLSQAAIVVT